MGSGAWSDSTYRSAAAFRRSAGDDDFGYTAATRSRPQREWRADPALDPKGVGLRESRDSAEHPRSTPIVVLFDVTGSMGQVPRIVQAKMSGLLGLLERQGYVSDPQIMFGAIGDADSDRVPLQVGQFESDNRMDDQLRSIFLEGNGGGQKSESYELAAYFVERHTATDHWDRRGRKGYLFVIGDELNKRRLEARHVRRVIGDTVLRDLAVEDVWAQVQERWETFYVLPRQTAYYDDPQVNEHWRALLGERLLRLEDPAAVAELIATTIGLLEDSVDLDEGLANLTAIGSDAGDVVGRALATVAAPGPGGRGLVRRDVEGRGGAVGLLPPGLDVADDLA